MRRLSWGLAEGLVAGVNERLGGAAISGLQAEASAGLGIDAVEGASPGGFPARKMESWDRAKAPLAFISESLSIARVCPHCLPSERAFVE